MKPSETSNFPDFQHSLVASFPDLDAIELHLYSKLRVLPCYDTTVDINQLGKAIMDAFAQEPHLPGVIVCDREQVFGMISRQRFLYSMSQPYSLELYLERPIQRFWEMFNTTVLELPCDCLIMEAVQKALARPYLNLYEPLAVRFSQEVVKVLDLHLLLLAQSKLFLEITQKLQEQATRDGLTQVSNRRQFDKVLRQEWQRLRRSRQPLALILCDVDEFKRYNDTYGHQAGDICLQSVAQLMTSAIKRPSDFVARYGGEEFVLLLPDTSLEGAQAVAELLRQQLQQKQIPHQASRVKPWVTVSLGITCLIPTGGVSPEMLVQQADEALYEAKKQGRDRAVVYVG